MPTRMSTGEQRKPLLAGIDMVSERMRTGRLKIIRSQCIPLIRELGLYHYDPTKKTEEPVKEDDHACDALRYLIVGIDRRKYMSGRRDIEAELQDTEQQETTRKEADNRAKREEDLRRQGDIEDPMWWDQ